MVFWSLKFSIKNNVNFHTKDDYLNILVTGNFRDRLTAVFRGCSDNEIFSYVCALIGCNGITDSKNKKRTQGQRLPDRTASFEGIEQGKGIP